MKPRWFINTLLAVLLLLPVIFGGIWWWSIQPPLLAFTEPEHRELTLAQGMQVQLLSDPELAHTHIEWRWAVGTSADPEDQLGRHQLFMNALTAGQYHAALPSLAVQMGQDPLGQFRVHLDRQHSLIQLNASVGATAHTLNYFARLLSQTDWAPELMRVQRESLTELDPAYAFIPVVEAQQIDRIRPMVRPLMQSTAVWQAREAEDLSRMLGRYLEGYFLPHWMTLSVRSPLPLAELEQLVRTDFANALRRQPNREEATELPAQYWTLRGAMSYGLEAAQTQSYNVRLMFPWSLSLALQPEVLPIVAWLNSPLPEAPRQQLREAGLLQDLKVQMTDEMLVFELRVEPAEEDRMPVVLASLQRLLGQMLSAQQRDRLRFDPHHFWQHDLRPSASNEVRELPSPDPVLALSLAQPPITLPLAPVSPTRASQYELIGRQPRLLRADADWRVWHLPDQHYGTRLTHLSVHWPHPMGSDPLVHQHWQEWFERHGPGLNEAVWQAQQQDFSGAQGFRVEVDATGIHWHLTHDWPTLERWLPRWLAQMQQPMLDPPPAPEPSLPVQRLLKDRAQLSAPPALSAQPAGPIQLLVSGRVEATDVMQWLAPMAVSAVAPNAAPPSAWRLAEGHQLAELEAPSGTSRVSTWVELPSSDHRNHTLAEASLPWIQATLEQQLTSREVAAQLTVALTAPAGRLGLEVVLESSSVDPARLNLQLSALWRDLAEASQNKSVNTLRQTLQWRADRYRESPPSLAAASHFYWSDIVSQRLHFNGRLRSARTLESTNLDGWAFFMQQWLFATTARRLTVNEVGENWAQTYRELRRPPPDARPW